MIAYMGTVTVILLNILIAQMSSKYTQAKKVARLDYDVDRILQLTRMERFPFLVNIRYVMRKNLIQHIVLPGIEETKKYVSSLFNLAKLSSNFLVV